MTPVTPSMYATFVGGNKCSFFLNFKLKKIVDVGLVVYTPETPVIKEIDDHTHFF